MNGGDPGGIVPCELRKGGTRKPAEESGPEAPRVSGRLARRPDSRRDLRIVLLAGGDSPERDVSLASSRSILAALEELGHDVEVLDPLHPEMDEARAREMLEGADIGRDPPAVDRSRRREAFVKTFERLRSASIDLVFNGLHGGSGEDGTVQAVLEYLGIPFTGSGSTGCRLAMEKAVARELVAASGVPVAEGFTVARGELPADGVVERIEAGPGFPVVVKPGDQGSSVGLGVVREPGEIEEALQRAFVFSPRVVVERYIEGREITVSVLGDEALPVLEVKPGSGLYDYVHKYTPGASEYLVPAPLDEALTESFSAHALAAFSTLRCSVYGRVDFRLSRDGAPFFLEVNTLPGMTARSLVPKSAAAAGMDFTRLIERITELSLQEKRRRC